MNIFKVFTSFIALLILVSCNTNPFTGDRDLALVSNSELFPMAFQQYDEFLSENKVDQNSEEAKMVKQVGQNIAEAAQKYLNSVNEEGYLDDYKWDYNLVQSDEVNAWAMPGGKIVVYSGLLPITQNETGLAVVMGHELAHALLNHGQRRMSQEQLKQIVGQGGSAALSGTKYGQIFNQAYGVGTELGVMLPYSRKFETQADELGLTLMAIAGYNPEEGVQLWERMAESGGQEPPEFLSTHPSNQSRIKNISEKAAEAKETAKKFGVTSFK